MGERVIITKESGAALIVLAATVVGYIAVMRLPLVERLLGGTKWVDLGRLYLGGMVLAIGIPLGAVAGLRGVSGEMVERINRAARPLFYGYSAFFFTFVVTLSILKVYSLHMYADLGNNLEILWRLTHGLGLTSPMFEDYHQGIHWFAAHFAPIAYLIAYPWFKWFPVPETLIVLQALALTSAAVPVMLYARNRIGREAGYWVGTAFLLYPTIQFIGLYEFGFLQFSIPFLAWAFYCLHMRRTWVYAVLIILAMFCREEVGLVVFMLGLYVAAIRREWKIGVVTAIVGLVYSVIAIEVIIPGFRQSGGLIYQKHFQAFGHTPQEVVANVVLSPWATFRYLLEPTRLGNFIMYFLPLHFLSFFSPAILAIALPNIASSFLADAVSVYSYFLYYLSPSIPFIFFSAIEGMAKVRRRAGSELIGAHVAMAGLICSILFGPSPVSRSFWEGKYQLGEFYSTNFHHSHYAITEHTRSALQVASTVPMDAVVSAEQPFLPHLYNRKRIYVFPTVKSDTQYVLIDRKHPLKAGFGETYLDFRRRPEFYYQLIENAPREWSLIKEVDGVRLFRRVGRR